MAAPKTCIDCQQMKITSQFNERTSAGRKYKMACCRDCEKKRQATYYQQRKLIAKLKERT